MAFSVGDCVLVIDQDLGTPGRGRLVNGRIVRGPYMVGTQRRYHVTGLARGDTEFTEADMTGAACPDAPSRKRWWVGGGVAIAVIAVGVWLARR
jgi:hypothetical protein